MHTIWIQMKPPAHMTSWMLSLQCATFLVGFCHTVVRYSKLKNFPGDRLKINIIQFLVTNENSLYFI